MRIIVLILLCHNFINAQDYYASIKGNKQYELSNHLDNILVTVKDRKLVSNQNYTADVKTAQDYYPFGMQMSERNLDSTYRLGFNGKETDNEVSGKGNQYDYGFRIYNPRIAKFLSIDPLTNSYPWYTPYQFAGNTPINSIDLDGLEEARVLRVLSESNDAYLTTSSDGEIIK